MKSSFSKNVIKALGHQKSIKEIAQDWMVYILAVTFVFIGWPGFIIWLIIDRQEKAKDLEWQKLQNFYCTKEFLIKTVLVETAESENFIDDPMGYTPKITFGHLNKAWQMFIEKIQSEDEIWYFEIPQGSQIGKYKIEATNQINGYAILKDKEIVDEFFTESYL